MRINNRGESSITLNSFLLHRLNAIRSEVLVIELKPVVIFSVFYIHPEIVDWETILGKVLASFNDYVSRDICPFTEMET